MINAILACDSKGGIARNGNMPWPKNIEDLRWFKSHTQGHNVVMGSNTWNSSMPAPLKYRANYVVSSQGFENFKGAQGVFHPSTALWDIVNLADATPNLFTWIIGGAQLLNLTMPLIQEFYLTRINGDFECDTFIPINEITKEYTNTYVREYDNMYLEIWRK